MSLHYHRRFCVAPMMRYSHRFARQFWRLLSPSALLYTEMIVADAIIHGNRQALLSFPAEQSPLALQLADNCPTRLAEAAMIGEASGYAEINLNCGCPSARVQKGHFGACLMKEPRLVASIVTAIKRVIRIPVTVKCRLAVDDMDAETALNEFVHIIQEAGCDALIVHARRAWLDGLNPAQNRHLPPLDYERVQRLKQSYPALPIIINGGIQTIDEAATHLLTVDGAMLGRAICRQPYLLAEAEARFFGHTPISRQQVLRQMLAHIRTLPASGGRRALAALAGLNHGLANNKYYRRCLALPLPQALQQLENNEQWV